MVISGSVFQYSYEDTSCIGAEPILKISFVGCQWLMSVILAPQEAEIRRKIMVPSQPI
jgi:hypothetical protein